MPTSRNRSDPVDTDLEEAARDQIAQLIAARFKGHGLARLVEAILKPRATPPTAARKAQTAVPTSSPVPGCSASARRVSVSR